MIKTPTGGGYVKNVTPALTSGVSVHHLADAVLIFAQFLRCHHPTLVIQHDATDLISDMLRGLQHQLEILQRIAVRRYLHKDSDAA